MTGLFKAHKARDGKTEPAPRRAAEKSENAKAPGKAGAARAKEIGGPSGPEPTRYGDWERKGICVDF